MPLIGLKKKEIFYIDLSPLPYSGLFQHAGWLPQVLSEEHKLGLLGVWELILPPLDQQLIGLCCSNTVGQRKIGWIQGFSVHAEKCLKKE